jgi:segregation and condensation protein B
MAENSDSGEEAESRKPKAEIETPPPLLRIIEALLFVGGPPLSAERAGEIIRRLPPEQFEGIIDELNRTYRRQRRPYVIQSSEQGYVLSLKPQFRGVVERLAASPREARLTDAALQVLSLIAYRQPVSKTEIDSQRGNDSRGPLQQLVRLGLVAAEPRPELGGNESGYVTTPRFLELFELRGLDDLPRAGDLQRL